MGNSEENQREYIMGDRERRDNLYRYKNWGGSRPNPGKEGQLAKATAKRRKARKAARSQR